MSNYLLLLLSIINDYNLFYFYNEILKILRDKKENKRSRKHIFDIKKKIIIFCKKKIFFFGLKKNSFFFFKFSL